MARERKFAAYRSIERPYTRRSKYSKKSYIKANPPVKVVRFVMGDKETKKFEYTLNLISKTDLQIRNSAIESGRLTAIRILEKQIGKVGFHFRILIYPHHVLRENPLASGAGADRMSTGMKMSFGKPIGLAARVFKGDVICTVKCDEKHLAIAKQAMNRFKNKVPTSCLVEIRKNSVKVTAKA